MPLRRLDLVISYCEEDLDWVLKSPKDGSLQQTIKARSLWIKILTARMETGEPYLMFEDAVRGLLALGSPRTRPVVPPAEHYL